MSLFRKKMFEGKVAVVTGGALGIGKHLTQEFAKSGAKVAFVDMNREAGEKSVHEIEKAGGEVLFYHGDIGKETDLKEFANRVIDQYGKVDFLVNNAMYSNKGILSECSYDDFNYSFRVGVTAPYFLTQLFLTHFAPEASIVNISSSRAFQSQPDTESYTAAKGGITALTHALAVSLSGKARVNSVSPGWIDTGDTYVEDYEPNYTQADIEQHPSKRVGNPMDIVRAIFFLCDQQNSFINGENIQIDGGMGKLMIYSGDEGWSYEEKRS